ncbi:hypothetical protein MSAN_01563400 [Mycena sanguinolenta]|uniref:Uncharacterized protein n=1 Tax=Mycena sanguinolenta TaxID=230812 RepID=A0A8H6Y3N5_9AGAR|nr:hypothetical protein MSAN_01563400 [Mycena sanguinolenta]
MSDAASSLVPPPPPPGLNYIAAIKPSVTLLMIGTVWCSMLIPLLVILFAFSSPSLRRRPLFILNVIAVLIGIVLGIANAYLEVVTSMLSPLTPLKTSVFITFTALVVYTPVFMDIILIFRVFIIYPPHTMPWPRRLAVFGPPIVFKFIRTANLIVLLVNLTTLINNGLNPIVAGQIAWSTHPWTKVEYFFQVFDNCYASLLFLLRVHRGRIVNARTGVSDSYASRLRSLFLIALGNFVFPSLLSIIQMIFLFHNAAFLNATYVFVTNCYVEIIGVLMATIWAAGDHRSEDRGSSSSGGTQISAIRYNAGIHVSHSVVRSVDQSMGEEKGVEMGVFKAALRTREV